MSMAISKQLILVLSTLTFIFHLHLGISSQMTLFKIKQSLKIYCTNTIFTKDVIVVFANLNRK